MIMFIIFVALLIALGFAATRWGFDSRDGLDSQDWQRRTLLVPPQHRMS